MNILLAGEQSFTRWFLAPRDDPCPMFFWHMHAGTRTLCVCVRACVQRNRLKILLVVSSLNILRIFPMQLNTPQYPLNGMLFHWLYLPWFIWWFPIVQHKDYFPFLALGTVLLSLPPAWFWGEGGGVRSFFCIAAFLLCWSVMIRTPGIPVLHCQKEEE